MRRGNTPAHGAHEQDPAAKFTGHGDRAPPCGVVGLLKQAIRPRPITGSLLVVAGAIVGLFGLAAGMAGFHADLDGAPSGATHWFICYAATRLGAIMILAGLSMLAWVALRSAI